MEERVKIAAGQRALQLFVFVAVAQLPQYGWLLLSLQCGCDVYFQLRERTHSYQNEIVFSPPSHSLLSPLQLVNNMFCITSSSCRSTFHMVQTIDFLLIFPPHCYHAFLALMCVEETHICNPNPLPSLSLSLSTLLLSFLLLLLLHCDVRSQLGSPTI